MTISTERLQELKARIAAMREAPPAAGMGITLQADEVEQFIFAIEGGDFAKLYALNQDQADKIEALQDERDALQAERDEAQGFVNDQRVTLIERDAKIDEQAAKIVIYENILRNSDTSVADEGPTGDGQRDGDGSGASERAISNSDD